MGIIPRMWPPLSRTVTLYYTPVSAKYTHLIKSLNRQYNHSGR